MTRSEVKMNEARNVTVHITTARDGRRECLQIISEDDQFSVNFTILANEVFLTDERLKKAERTG
jgi:hypothetical protein